MTLARSAGGHPPNRPFLVWGFHRLSTGKGVLSEQEHFPSGASGQSSLEYKCAYLCLYIRKSSLDYDSIKIFIKISCIWPPHMEIVIKVVQCLGG